MPELIEITGKFLGERYRKDGWIIASVESIDGGKPDKFGQETVKGDADIGELVIGLEYRFYGKYEIYQGKESFAFRSFVPITPHGRAGVIKYLQQAPNVGLATAEALWDVYESEAVEVLRDEPLAAVAAVNSRYFTIEKATEAAAHLEAMGALEGCTIDLLDLLDGRGFPKDLPHRLMKRFGNRGAELIRKNPYLLLSEKGVGFLRADVMYLEFGHKPDRLKRQTLCILHAIQSDTNGHIWYPQEFAIRTLREKISGTSIRCGEAIRLGVRADKLVVRNPYKVGNDTCWIADGDAAEDESFVSAALSVAMAGRFSGWCRASKTSDISEHQAENLDKATQSKIGILGGSPGTGKTFVAADLLKEQSRYYLPSDIAVCAPTGKAAVRITEAMESYDLDLQATTIHRLLETGPTPGGGWSFGRNTVNPLDEKFIVVDEASMIDTSLMASLLAARGPDTHILFVGDINQLPPVGRGAPLRDMIAAGLPYGKLTKIHRNAGTIVRVCTKIKDNKSWEPDLKIDLVAKPPRNLKLLEASSAIFAQHRLVNAVVSTAGFCDPIWDCQVIVATNAKSPLSRTVLNPILQRLLNVANEEIEGTPFRVGDKVICLKNSMFEGRQGGNHGKCFVANGDIGKVIEAKPKKTIVLFTGPDRLVAISRVQTKQADWTGCDLDLAYAVTCHKYQGSEVPYAFVCLDDSPGARMVCSREWLHTAISRAKIATILVGRIETAYAMCQKQAIHERKTFLTELIQEWSVAADKSLPRKEGDVWM